MKTPSTPSRMIRRSIAAAVFALATPVFATNLHWDGGTTEIPTNGDGISIGGAGTWNTTLLNWDVGTSLHVAWSNANNDTAIFGGAGTTSLSVTLGTPVTVGGLQFTRTGYTISGSTITLASGAAISMTADGTIGSVLTGNSDLTKTGAGRLFLTAANTYSGTTAASGGLVDFTNISLAGFGGGSGRNISVAANGAVRRNALDNAFLNRLVETNSEITVMTGATSNSFDFSSSTGANLPTAFLGNWASNGAKCEYSGTLTPASDNYRLGGRGSGGLLGIFGTNKLTSARGLIVGGTGGGGIRVELAGANNFTGDTVITSGAKLTIGNNLALQNSALNLGSSGGGFALSNGLLSGRITGSSESLSPTFGGLKGSRNLLAAFSTSAGNNEQLLASTAVTGFTLNPASGTTCTYSGVIADFATGTTLTKTGTGTQVLTGINTYKGATTVQAGTLAISQPYLALQSPVTVSSGATLRLDFSGTVQLTTLVLNGVTLPPGLYNSGNNSPYIAGSGSISVVDLDTDDDGMPDTYELANTTPPSATGLNPGDNLDTDGLTNLQEYQLGTNPNLADTDGDSLNDGPEITGVAPRPPTNPIKADTDGDGLSDGVETNTTTWAGNSNTGTNPAKADTDSDGLNDGLESNTGSYVSDTNTGTSPLDIDSDDDNTGDWYEVAACYTNPTNPASKPKVPYPLPRPDSSTGSTGKPVKVFIMMGQSNMVGHGNVDSPGTLGTLSTIVKQQGKFPNLLDIAGTNWLPRNDVTYKGVIAATAAGPLAPGQGGGSGSIGPELGFGQIMGHTLDEPVLLLKTSEGGKDLGYQLLPPGSPQYTSGAYTYAGYGDSPRRWLTGSTPIPDGTQAGEQYNKTVAAAKGVLTSFNTLYPLYATQGYVIAGFVWFQGYNDLIDNTNGYPGRYELNLVNYIKAIRAEFGAPNAPFVVATCGFSGWAASGNTLTVINAQLAVGDPAKYPEFAGNVKSAETRGYWRTVAQSPADESYHYNRNAETYMLVGDAAGRSMIDLMAASSDYDNWQSAYPGADLANPTADLDGDGMSNDQERIFGLNPTTGSSANAITTALNATAGTFSYTRRDDVLTGYGFEVWTSDDLVNWARDSGAVQTPGALDGNHVETVAVQLSPALLAAPGLFVRVRAVK